MYCDGKALPVTDEPLILPPGKHTCKAMKSGFRSSSQTFVVAAGRSLERVFSQISNTNAPAKATRSKANVPGRKAFFAAP